VNSREEKIRELEEELRKTAYNKATMHHIGKVKAKIARLRQEAEKERAKKAGVGGFAYGIKKAGDATALLVGFPSVGKSTLLNKLTNAKSRVAEYEFTTLKVIPGMMEHKGAHIQLLDVPGLVEGAAEGRGRGKEVLSVVRVADLVVIMVEVTKPKQRSVIEKELYGANLRLDRKPPDMTIKKKSRGGIRIASAVELEVTDEALKSVLQEYGVHNAEATIREKIILDDFIDVLAGNRKYVPSIVVFNKKDLLDTSDLEKKHRDAFFISAEKDEDFAKLKDEIFDRLELIRVYMKKVGKEADRKEPLIMHKGDTVENVCNRIHKTFMDRFRYARVWGPSAKFGGQSVGLSHRPGDEDVLEIHVL
jgi:small GTP-binding protein